MPIDVKVPEVGESVKEAILLKWYKNDGDAVQVDDMLCALETDKANVDIPAQAAGQFKRLKNEGDTVNVGETIAQIEPGAAGPRKAVETVKTQSAEKEPAPAKAAAKETAPAKREERAAASAPPRVATSIAVEASTFRRLAAPPAPTTGGNGGAGGAKTAPLPVPATPPTGPLEFDDKGVARQPMSRIRKRIAQTLVEAQHTAAILTTYNEVDLTSVVEIRARFKERFQELYGVGLGYMSFFARAVVLALREVPKLNAFIDGDNIAYHNYVHLGIAVSTERGLAVPVLRNVQNMGFARIESEIKRLAAATRDGKLAVDELSGGTFSITNGGIFGSLLSTPILTPPQSGILGMHAIQKRPVVINDKIEIRQMMYIALSYDHRLVDGKESVTFLVRLKQYLEDPARLMLEI